MASSPRNEEEPGAEPDAKKVIKKKQKKLEGVWKDEEIETAISKLEQQIAENPPATKRRRMYKRLGELKAALRGETTVGGKVAPSEKKGKKPDFKKEKGQQGVKCLYCREVGHSVKVCRKAKSERAAAEKEGTEDLQEASTAVSSSKPSTHLTGICYNCGSKAHSLKACPEPRKPDGSLPFALCFVCKQMGHIVSKCPQNTSGVYPEGGECRTCGSVEHLQRDCPLFKAQQAFERDQDRDQSAERRGGESGDFEGNAEFGRRPGGEGRGGRGSFGGFQSRGRGGRGRGGSYGGSFGARGGRGGMGMGRGGGMRGRGGRGGPGGHHSGFPGKGLRGRRS
uniref:CCHC-type domain-containing protein n=1 Tax=Chromera velia CCMP2878 TaxID=1169474 RepID=A0A0G4HJ28_9ALVE|eukprot:Cvel_1081.t1-p1 / transcript=Cvel_1081.t1 / gene=Cvel_1081 / organism=Chromera_velia_CCMP2878 / gene_product=Zinc finger CCHC domain-containing protein 9, putative / transcript_product=Zinc finger CCHC domain-containing protein 9, putative / location=Cvel_scaffold35:54006-55753(+) / protein_length=337 / sequence_SO=supercontig / SO=protein_coding / is_pseudo=false